jgi:hypothetical protein
VAWRLLATLPAGVLGAELPGAATPSLPIEEHVLSNGMKLVLIPQHISPTVSGVWVAHVGSANERPGMTGISHLFEHMMFKGTHVIGTRDYDTDIRLIEEQERLQEEMRAEISKMRVAQRRGELEDITKPEARHRATAARAASTRSLPRSARTWSRTSSTWCCPRTAPPV